MRGTLPLPASVPTRSCAVHLGEGNSGSRAGKAWQSEQAERGTHPASVMGGKASPGRQVTFCSFHSAVYTTEYTGMRVWPLQVSLVYLVYRG